MSTEINSVSPHQFKNSVRINLDCARTAARKIEEIISSCHRRFELVYETHVIRLSDPPCCIREAQARHLCALNYLDAVEKLCEGELSEEHVHRSERAMYVAWLLQASVKALLVPAYIILAKHNPAWTRFEALAQQAQAYADNALGGNWEYFVPSILIWEDKALPEKSRRNATMLMDYAELAWSYAQTFDRQSAIFRHYPASLAKDLVGPLKHGERIGRTSRVASVEAHVSDVRLMERNMYSNYWFGGSEEPPVAYELPRVPSYMENPERNRTRDEVEQSWGCSVYDDAREASHYGGSSKWRSSGSQPKDRLVGFAKRRGGSGARARRKSARAADRASVSAQ